MPALLSSPCFSVKLRPWQDLPFALALLKHRLVVKDVSVAPFGDLWLAELVGPVVFPVLPPPSLSSSAQFQQASERKTAG